jgi:hypothetical protein
MAQEASSRDPSRITPRSRTRSDSPSYHFRRGWVRLRLGSVASPAGDPVGGGRAVRAFAAAPLQRGAGDSVVTSRTIVSLSYTARLLSETTKEHIIPKQSSKSGLRLVLGFEPTLSIVSPLDLRQNDCIVAPSSREELQDAGGCDGRLSANDLPLPRPACARWRRRMFCLGRGACVSDRLFRRRRTDQMIGGRGRSRSRSCRAQGATGSYPGAYHGKKRS